MNDAEQYHEASVQGSQWFPELLGEQRIMPGSGGPGLFELSLPPSKGELTILVNCYAPEFPFERYCRFVRHPGQRYPYTFSSMEFHKSAPGIRLGPWPGWRGIPDFPVVTASCGTDCIRLQPTFWGDEISAAVLRFLGRFPCATDNTVVISVADPGIVPHLASIYHTRALKARPRPTRIPVEIEGVHPRLLITTEFLAQLRDRILGSHKMLWRKILALWENRALPFDKSAESKCVPGPERLSGEDRVLLSALIALVTEGEDEVREALRAYDEYIRLTGSPGFEPLGIDTQAGEVLFMLSVGFDWLSRWMPDSQRKSAWERIEQVAGICDSFLTSDRTDYGQAHYLGCGLGLLSYAFLLPGADGSPRLARLRGALDCALDLLPPDGSYPHGINLWIYEFSFLLRWIELIRICSGEDIWRSQGGALERASAFRAATLSADGMQGLTFGDAQYRVGGDSWCHFLIASRTRSGRAQWLGDRLAELPHEGVDFRDSPARRRVYEFLYFDPSVTPTAPGTGVEVFPELGQVTVRSSRTYFTLRSGPPLGRRRYASGEYGAYGHSDPANGSFLLERDGRFIVSGPGPLYRRDTSLHNVVTFDGQGQLGDSTVWLPDFFPPERLAPTPDVTIEGSGVSVTIDLARTYLPHLGVRRYTRVVYSDPERLVLGVDDILCEVERSIEWNMHSRLPFEALSGGGPLLFNIGTDVKLALLSPLNAAWEVRPSDFIPAYPNDGVRDHHCVVKARSVAARFVWCYLLGSQSIPQIRDEDDRTLVVVLSSGISLHYDGLKLQARGKP